MINERTALWNAFILGECLRESEGDVPAALEAAELMLSMQPVPDNFALSTDSSKKFHRPENYDKVMTLKDGNELWAGGNDWESGWTWAGIHEPKTAGNPEQIKNAGRKSEPIRWLEVDHSKCPGCKGTLDCHGGKRNPCMKFAKDQVAKWAKVNSASLSLHSDSAAFAHDIHNPRAQDVLTQALKGVRGLNAAARRDLKEALKHGAEGNSTALLDFAEKYRVQLARLLNATQMAALLEGANEVARKLPEGATLPQRGDLPFEPPAPPAGSPEALHFPVIEAAARNLSERNVLDRERYDALDAAARQKALTVAGVDTQATLTKIRDVLAENVRKGADYGTFSKAVLDAVEEGTFLSDPHMETVFRTNVQSGFSDGQASVLDHPQVRSGFPYSAYDAIHDDRVRENHLALESLGIDGTNVYRNDDPVFKMFRPPWDYNDRCSWTPLTVRQAAEMGVEEAQKWLRTGEEPYPPAYVPMPDFRPPEGFERTLATMPLSIQLSLQPLAAFSTFDPKKHPRAKKGSEKGGQFVKKDRPKAADLSKQATSASNEAITAHEALTKTIGRRQLGHLGGTLDDVFQAATGTDRGLKSRAHIVAMIAHENTADAIKTNSKGRAKTLTPDAPQRVEEISDLHKKAAAAHFKASLAFVQQPHHEEDWSHIDLSQGDVAAIDATDKAVETYADRADQLSGSTHWNLAFVLEKVYNAIDGIKIAANTGANTTDAHEKTAEAIDSLVEYLGDKIPYGAKREADTLRGLADLFKSAASKHRNANKGRTDTTNGEEGEHAEATKDAVAATNEMIKAYHEETPLVMYRWTKGMDLDAIAAMQRTQDLSEEFADTDPGVKSYVKHLEIADLHRRASVGFEDAARRLAKTALQESRDDGKKAVLLQEMNDRAERLHREAAEEHMAFERERTLPDTPAEYRLDALQIAVEVQEMAKELPLPEPIRAHLESLSEAAIGAASLSDYRTKDDDKYRGIAQSYNDILERIKRMEDPKSGDGMAVDRIRLEKSKRLNHGTPFMNFKLALRAASIKNAQVHNLLVMKSIAEDTGTVDVEPHEITRRHLEGMMSNDFDPEKHPRKGKGEGGGQFTSSGRKSYKPKELSKQAVQISDELDRFYGTVLQMSDDKLPADSDVQYLVGESLTGAYLKIDDLREDLTYAKSDYDRQQTHEELAKEYGRCARETKILEDELKKPKYWPDESVNERTEDPDKFVIPVPKKKVEEIRHKITELRAMFSAAKEMHARASQALYLKHYAEDTGAVDMNPDDMTENDLRALMSNEAVQETIDAAFGSNAGIGRKKGDEWITIGGHPDPEKGTKHSGGFRVLVSDNGKIKAGRLKGSNLSDVKSHFDRVKGKLSGRDMHRALLEGHRKRMKNAPQRPPATQPQPGATDGRTAPTTPPGQAAPAGFHGKGSGQLPSAPSATGQDVAPADARPGDAATGEGGPSGDQPVNPQAAKSGINQQEVSPTPELTPEQIKAQKAAERAAEKARQHEAKQKLDRFNERLERYRGVFEAKGNEIVAEWLDLLQDHVAEIGTEHALELLGSGPSGEAPARAQYEGAYDELDPSKATAEFIRDYLNRAGITLVQSNGGIDPNMPYVSSWSEKNLEAEGRKNRPRKEGDYIPTDQTFKNKLEEAKHLPGLESSEDIDKIVGSKVTQFTPEVIAKLDERFGKGKWIVKSYGEEAFAGFGVYFPQRVKQIQDDAKAQMKEAIGELKRFNLKPARDENGNIIGLTDMSGKNVYSFNSEAYNGLHKTARRLGKQLANAAHAEKGTLLPQSSVDALRNDYGVTFLRDKKGVPIGITNRDGKDYNFGSSEYKRLIGGDEAFDHDIERALEADEASRKGEKYDPVFMAQPAFEAVGVSDEDRAAGATWETAPEGRVHVTTKGGVASVIPYASLAGRVDAIPIVFHNDDTRAMEKAVEDAINQLPESERTGQLYAPDVVKTKDGWKVIELNPSAVGGGSDWLGRNPMVMDAVVAHMTGREPAHVAFIRKLLGDRQKQKRTGRQPPQVPQQPPEERQPQAAPEQAPAVPQPQQPEAPSSQKGETAPKRSKEDRLSEAKEALTTAQKEVKDLTKRANELYDEIDETGGLKAQREVKEVEKQLKDAKARLKDAQQHHEDIEAEDEGSSEDVTTAPKEEETSPPPQSKKEEPKAKSSVPVGTTFAAQPGHRYRYGGTADSLTQRTKSEEEHGRKVGLHDKHISTAPMPGTSGGGATGRIEPFEIEFKSNKQSAGWGGVTPPKDSDVKQVFVDVAALLDKRSAATAHDELEKIRKKFPNIPIHYVKKEGGGKVTTVEPPTEKQIAESKEAARRWEEGEPETQSKELSHGEKLKQAYEQKKAVGEAAEQKYQELQKKHSEAYDKVEAARKKKDNAKTPEERRAAQEELFDAADAQRAAEKERDEAFKTARAAQAEHRFAQIDHEMHQAESRGGHLTVDRVMKAAEAHNVPKHVQKQYHEHFSHIAKRMPKEASRMFNAGLLGDFKFYGHVNDVDREAKKLGSTAQGQVQGFFNPSEGDLHVDGDSVEAPSSSKMSKSDAVRGVFAHEMTHALDHGNLLKTGTSFSDDPEWQAAFKEEAREIGDYAATEPGEAFAEFGRMVYSSDVSKDEIKKTLPKSYAFFKKIGIIDW